MPTGKTIKIFVVEDESLLRELLAGLLSTIEGFDVVGTAAEGEAALRAIKLLKPDVVLMDVDLGDGVDGIQVGVEARQADEDLAIVILTAAPQVLDAASAIIEGGSRWSYLSKRAMPGIAALERTIRGAAEGMTVFDPAIVEIARQRQSTGLRLLTKQQTEVLFLLAQGFANDAIGRELGISHRTVEYHLQEIYGRLETDRQPEMNPRVHAALWFARQVTAHPSHIQKPRTPGAGRTAKSATPPRGGRGYANGSRLERLQHNRPFTGRGG